MLVLGMVGRARSGKSTAAESMLVDAGHWAVKAKMYDIGAEVLAECIRQGYVPNKKREDLDADELAILVDVGKQRRALDPNYWINSIEARMIEENPVLAIIPNVRFGTEVALIQKMNGKLIRVTALNADGSEFISRDRDPNDTSETGLHALPVDYYITAVRGDIELIRRQAQTLCQYLLSQYFLKSRSAA